MRNMARLGILGAMASLGVGIGPAGLDAFGRTGGGYYYRPEPREHITHDKPLTKRQRRRLRGKASA